jgi:hypothetical protein
MGFRTRKGKLENKLREEIGKSHPSLERVVEVVEDYEKDNLKTIEKLKREKKVTVNKINGALKQSINSHGPLTKELIGSATKRIYGSLLEPQKKKKKFYPLSFIGGVIVTLILGIIIYLSI